MFGIGGALWILIVSRILDGLTGGNVSTAQALIADLTPARERAAAFATLGALFSLGFILGPIIGGALGQLSVVLPAYAAGAASLLSVTMGYFLLPESLHMGDRSPAPLTWRDLDPFRPILSFARLPGMASLLGATFVFNLVYGCLASNFAVYTIDRFHAKPVQNALIFTTVGAAGAATQVIGVRPLASRIGEKRLALSGLLVQIVGLLGILVAPAFVWLYGATGLIGIGNGLMRPALTALMSNPLPLRAQGRIAGVSLSLMSLAYVVGPLWAGLSYDHIGPSTPYWSGALLLLVTWAMLSRSTLTPVVIHS